MKNKLFLLFSLMIVWCGSSFMSCSDDDSPLFLEDYIIGTWKSYKYVAYMEDETYTINITKTGPASGSYFEVTFNQDGSGTERFWKQDNNGTTRWTEEQLRYTVSGNTVNVYDQEGNVQFVLDEKTKSLYYRSVVKIYGENTTVFIYMKK